MKSSNVKPGLFFAVAITFLFALLGYFGILHHEMWLDETHHFLLARDSFSISEMAFHARYEGHPLLWNVLLFILTRFSADPFYMQLLNLSIAVAAVFLFLRYAPFSKLVKTAIVFSYFIFYEYGLISRNYALSFLLLVLVCIFFSRRKTHFLFLVFTLFLLAQTHLFSALIAVALSVLLVYEYFSSTAFRPRFFFPGMILLALSFVFVAWQSFPPPDHFLYQYDADPYLSFKRIGKALSVMWKGLFPIPDFFTDHPWNSNGVIAFSKKLAIIPAALAWLVPAILLKRKKISLLFFYSVATGMMLFIYFSPLIVAARHCGFFFLLLIATMWLQDYFPGTEKMKSSPTSFSSFRDRFQKPLLLLLLFVQLTGSIYLYITDWKRPFSNAKAVSEWLIAHKREKDFIIVNDHSTGPAIAAYLQRKVYYAENNSEGSFCRWNTKPFLISQDTLYGRISRLLEAHDSLILVSSRPLPFFPFSKHPGVKEFSLRQLSSFNDALVRAENYTVYSVAKKNP